MTFEVNAKSEKNPFCSTLEAASVKIDHEMFAIGIQSLQDRGKRRTFFLKLPVDGASINQNLLASSHQKPVIQKNWDVYKKLKFIHLIIHSNKL